MSSRKLVGGLGLFDALGQESRVTGEGPAPAGQNVEGRYGRNWDETECSGRAPSRTGLKDSRHTGKDQPCHCWTKHPQRVAASEASGSEPETADQALRKEVGLLKKWLSSYQRGQKLASYEIYDGLVQRLAAALWRLQSSRQPPGREPNQGQEAFDKGIRLVTDAMLDAKKLIHRLRRPLLDELGVEGAIKSLLREGEQGEGLDVEFVHDVHLEGAIQSLIREAEGRCGSSIELIHNVQFERLAPPLETAIFRVVREALTDGQGFIGSGTVRMTMAEEHNRVYIEVQSWEVALNSQQAQDRRVRLERIRRQAELLGGRVTTDSVTDEATRIAVELPLLEMVPGQTDPKPQ